MLNILAKPFLNKSVDWNYEKEWRVLLNKRRLNDICKNFDLNNFFFKKNEHGYFILFPKPKSIFMGLKIKEEDEITIKKLYDKNGIKVYKMKKDKSSCYLTYEEII